MITPPFRIGIGFDTHPLVPNRPLILGGVSIPYHMGLLGHSDADVLTHVIIDAIIGAMNWGSIGLLFPNTDNQWKNSRSVDLLALVIQRLLTTPYRVSNVDATIVAQSPKLMPFRDEMSQELAKTLQVNPQLVSIKATTSEGLGPEGRGEGISAHAVVLLAHQ